MRENTCQIEKYWIKYIDLENSCLTEKEKKEVMDVPYTHIKKH